MSIFADILVEDLLACWCVVYANVFCYEVKTTENTRIDSLKAHQCKFRLKTISLYCKLGSRCKLVIAWGSVVTKSEDFQALTTWVNGRFASVFTSLRWRRPCETGSRGEFSHPKQVVIFSWLVKYIPLTGMNLFPTQISANLIPFPLPFAFDSET